MSHLSIAFGIQMLTIAQLAAPKLCGDREVILSEAQRLPPELNQRSRVTPQTN